MAQHTFLVEIGTAELPPKALRSLAEAFADNFKAELTKADLAFGEDFPHDGGGLVQVGRELIHIPADELVALDEAAAQAHVHQADHVLPAKGLDPAAELFEVAGGGHGADEGTDGAAADDLRLDALPRQRPQHAHMGPAAGGAAAEGDADAGGAFHEACGK